MTRGRRCQALFTISQGLGESKIARGWTDKHWSHSGHMVIYQETDTRGWAACCVAVFVFIIVEEKDKCIKLPPNYPFTTPSLAYITVCISPGLTVSSIMQLLAITFALATTTLASPLSLVRRDPIPNAGAFTSWSCFDCAASNPCLSWPHDNIVSETCYPLEAGQASLQVYEVASPSCVCTCTFFFQRTRAMADESCSATFRLGGLL
jgi:hypothetical protein